MFKTIHLLTLLFIFSICPSALAFVQMAQAKNPLAQQTYHIYSSSYPSYYGYPSVLSQPIDVLPAGTITLFVGTEIYYYFNGIFFQKNVLEQQYFIVPPPIGAVVFNIPQGYQMVVLNGISFYESAGVFYKRVLEGYKVVRPPVDISSETVTVSSPVSRPITYGVY
jgi:hypothetical protein